MPEASDDLYSRGKYRLEWDRRKDGTLRTPFLQILWYDAEAGRNRSKSTGTADIAEAEDELDKLYLKKERGQAVCSHCGQTIRDGSRFLVTTAIADYLVLKDGLPSISSIKPRLNHVLDYLDDSDLNDIACEDVDEDWISDFREWAMEIPVTSVKGAFISDRSPGTVEASVRQLAAVINSAHNRKDTLFPAAFTAKKPAEVSRSPAHRSDINELALMFRYCLYPKGKTDKIRSQRRAERLNLLRFLQISIATWCRPDAAHDVSTDRERDQWYSNARALNLNQKGRTQTRKYRPIVPIAHQVAPLLDNTAGYFVTVASVRKAFEAMQVELGLPRERETGLKLIRRSVSKIGRGKLGEADWIEGKIMLGHHRSSTSDIYAPFESGYLAKALAATESIIDEICALCPGAFHRSGTGLKLVAGGKNG